MVFLGWSLLMEARLIKYSTPRRKINQLENLGHYYSQMNGMKILRRIKERRKSARNVDFEVTFIV
jgi:transcription initiation factor IIE alpha subunit